MDADINTRYTAEDWEGFQELVQASNIQDKDVILRVLSMYSDPEEREQQIRNLSAGFKELADEILPELRRARLTINYNIIGRSDDEIQAQYKADASQLSIEEVLYAATLTDNAAETIARAGREFGDIDMLTRSNAPDGEIAFVTDAIREGDFESKLGRLGADVKSVIRITDY